MKLGRSSLGGHNSPIAPSSEEALSYMYFFNECLGDHVENEVTKFVLRNQFNVCTEVFNGFSIT